MTFIKSVKRKKTDILLNSKNKLKHEKKKNYKKMLTFSFNNLENFFLTFQRNFVKNSKFSVSKISKNFADFKLNNLDYLQSQKSEFKQDIENCDFMFYNLNKHKESYFHKIHSIKPSKLNSIRNFTKMADKGKIKRLPRTDFQRTQISQLPYQHEQPLYKNQP